MTRYTSILLISFFSLIKAQDLTIETSSLYPSPGDNINILLYLDLENFVDSDGNQFPFSNYDCIVSYTSEVLSNPVVDDTDGFINNFTFVDNVDSAGQINFLAYSTSDYVGNGGLLASIEFIISESAQDGDVAEIIIDEFSVNEIPYIPELNSISLTINCPPDIDDDCDGVLNEDEIDGCNDEKACNYNSDATNHNPELCQYPNENYNCDGNCIASGDNLDENGQDCAGVCGGSALSDACGVCIDGANDFTYECVLGCDGLYYNDGNEPDQIECDGCPWYDECGVCEGEGIPDGFCDCDSLADCAPIISSIIDVPNDQGGWVYINFIKSFADNNYYILSRDIEMYTIQRYDNSANLWINIASGAAYGSDSYTYEVHSSIDSSNVSNGILEYRVIASMDEGIWVSSSSQGYSVDNIAPYPPSNIQISLLDNLAQISWDESNDYDFYGYKIYSSTDEDFIPLEDNLVSFQSENFFIENNIDLDRYYIISSVDNNGNESSFSNYITIESNLSNETESYLPFKNSINNNYPNPFNPTTVIQYEIHSNSLVELELYDNNGKHLKELFKEVKSRGSYTYTLSMDSYPSGIYIVNMYVDNIVADSKKIMYIK